MTKEQQEMLERFDERFPQEDFREDMNNGERERFFMLANIRDFLLQETERARKEERENNESGDIIAQTLVKYSQWLEKNGYMDCDWWAEEPRAVDRFLQTLKEE